MPPPPPIKIIADERCHAAAADEPEYAFIRDADADAERGPAAAEPTPPPMSAERRAPSDDAEAAMMSRFIYETSAY